MKVKICGIMEPQQGRWAAEAGADFVGVILAPSRRRIDPAKVRAIGHAVVAAGLRDRVSLVGVFVNEKPEQVNEIAEACSLDCVQLSGDEPWEYCQLIRRPVIRALKLDLGLSGDEIASRLEDGWKRLGPHRMAMLIEPLMPGSYGGAGRRLNWDEVGQLSSTVPVLLAGGLGPDNVGLAIRMVKPWGVDVSSGVETDGIKDEAKIRAFVVAARRSE